MTGGMTDLISPVVVLDQVSKLFAGRRALDRVSLTIEPGEFVAVIGRSEQQRGAIAKILAQEPNSARWACTGRVRGASGVGRSAPGEAWPIAP